MGGRGAYAQQRAPLTIVGEVDRGDEDLGRPLAADGLLNQLVRLHDARPDHGIRCSDPVIAKPLDEDVVSLDVIADGQLVIDVGGAVNLEVAADFHLALKPPTAARKIRIRTKKELHWRTRACTRATQCNGSIASSIYHPTDVH